MKTNEKKKNWLKNWLVMTAFRGNFMCVFLLAPTANVDSCCEIDGVYYEDGTVNPDNSCEICDITRSMDSWSSAVIGTSCDYCMHCDGQGTCGEIDDNCCNTASPNGGTCQDAPAMLLKEGCVFTHELDGVQNELSSGMHIDLMCQPDGTFYPQSISHSTIQPCPGCPDELWEYWEVSNCEVEYNSGVLTCSGNSSATLMKDALCSTAPGKGDTSCETADNMVYRAEKSVRSNEIDCVACPSCCANEAMASPCSDELLLDTSDNCLYATQCLMLDSGTWLKRTTRAFCLSDGQFPADIKSFPVTKR